MRGNLFVSLMVLLLTLLPILPVEAQSPEVPAIGMSGSIYARNLTIPVGGMSKVSSYFIVVYNHRNEPVNVSVTYETEGPLKVFFVGEATNNTMLQGVNFTLPPRGNARFTVVVNASDDAVPGVYKIIIKAFEVREKVPGKVSITLGDVQESFVNIIGEYGFINASALDPAGNVVKAALLRLYRLVDGKLEPYFESLGGRIYVKVVPGNYTVVAYLMGEEAGRINVTVGNLKTATASIPLRIVYFRALYVTPIYSEEGRLISVRIHAVITNIFKSITDTRIILRVRKDGDNLENRTFIQAGVLPIGTTDYFFDYVPLKGWHPGNYTFEMLVFGYGGRLLAMSPSAWVYVPPKATPIYLYMIIGGGVAGGFIIIFILIRKRKKQT